MPLFDDVVFLLSRLVGGFGDEDMEHLRAFWFGISRGFAHRLWMFLWWAWVRAEGRRIPITRVERTIVRTGTEPDEEGRGR